MLSLHASVFSSKPVPVSNPPVPGMVWQPINCTLIYTATEAVLVDTPTTIEATKDLAAWIEATAPGRKLKYIYITHGHGDHFFGIPILLERFPGSKAVATHGVIAHAIEQPEIELWDQWFPNQIYKPQVMPEPLEPGAELLLDGVHRLIPTEVGRSDTGDTTVLWVPELKLAVCGDAVYGQCHQWLYESNTPELRQQWIQAIEKIEALGPMYVVPGHSLQEEIHGVWHLAETKQYLRDFSKVMESNPKSAEEIMNGMIQLYPERFNRGILAYASAGAMQALGEQ